MSVRQAIMCGLVVVAGSACVQEPCGPDRAEVVRVLDGDTAELAGGAVVRYLLVDAPELSRGDCYAREALAAHRALVLGRTLELRYPEECRDAYGRRLAFASVDGVDVSRALVEHGLARVFYVPPSGGERRAELLTLQALARAERRGMWGACRAEAP